jgi:hypothetical protein
MPWEYRERKRKESAAAPPPSCPPEPDPLKAQCVIKGNVSGNGRIYHMPGSPDYEKVVIIWGSTFATRVTGKHRAERQPDGALFAQESEQLSLFRPVGGEFEG